MIKIELTELQHRRLKRIKKAYSERGLNYSTEETLRIILRTHLKEYIDRQLDCIEEQLTMNIKGRAMGGTTWMRGAEREQRQTG